MFKQIEEFSKSCLGMDEETFCDRFQFPFLLLIADSLQKDTDEFFTTKMEKIKESEPSTGPGCFVIPIVTKDGSLPADSLITLGRTANNDIQIRHSVFSKFHCYFQVEGGR